MTRTMDGTEVRRIRRDLGLTQEGLAREMGITFGTVNRWESGRHVPKGLYRQALERLAKRAAKRAARTDA